MMGSFFSRASLMVLGYAYPAYQCFKAVEKNKPEIEQLLFWCQYWILVATLTVCERVGDNLISWFPMYSEAKLAFFMYLSYSKPKGTYYVYNFLLRPCMAKHEKEIDRRLLELSVKGREIGLLVWKEAASYGQTRLLDVLRYFPSQHLASEPHPDQRNSSSHSINRKQSESQQQHDERSSEAHSLETMPVGAAASKQCKTVSEEVVATPQAQTCGKWRIFRSAAANR